MKRRHHLKEIIVRADEQSLNDAIDEKKIGPENIVSVMLQPSNGLAVGDYEAKFRVLIGSKSSPRRLHPSDAAPAFEGSNGGGGPFPSASRSRCVSRCSRTASFLSRVCAVITNAHRRLVHPACHVSRSRVARTRQGARLCPVKLQCQLQSWLTGAFSTPRFANNITARK